MSRQKARKEQEHCARIGSESMSESTLRVPQYVPVRQISSYKTFSEGGDFTLPPQPSGDAVTALMMRDPVFTSHSPKRKANAGTQLHLNKSEMELENAFKDCFEYVLQSQAANETVGVDQN